MDSLYKKGLTVGKPWMHFSEFFRNSTRPTAKHLFGLALSTLALNGFRSVKNSFEHFVSDISEHGLKSFCFVLRKGKMELQGWSWHLIEAALFLLPSDSHRVF